MKVSSKRLTPALLALLLAACAAPQKRPLPDRPVAEPPSPSQPAAVSAEPAKDPQTRFNEALAALKAKKLKEAREGFGTLAKEHPELAGPLTNLGILDAKAGQRQAAVAQFSRALVANPQNAIAYNWLGILYRESGDYARAEQSYLRALAIQPNDAAVILNLGMLYDVYLKRPADALARYREYQTLTGTKELKVTAWIRALEASQAPVTTEAGKS
ncbi:MAG: tetratricopeptide repeat protein [Stagnimonas sp.]|nr:tetratricopeptide repeat protein [Stagnimonas sp.]